MHRRVAEPVQVNDPNQKMAATPAPVEASSPVIQQWCKDIGEKIRKYHWPEDPCQVTHWKVWGNSTEGRPLVYADFGNPDSTNTTLVFAMVHGDEFTPLFIGLRLSKWVQDNMDVFPTARIIVVPLVNPDGFSMAKPTRVNAHGVDLNRNFDTKDWQTLAYKNWKNKYHSDPRRYPGETPESEIETKFQIELIRLVRPTKIISVHAPLNFLDYDGPTTLSLYNFSSEYVKKCQELRSQIRAVSGGFFPGSLGNYAGQERGIPTFTLELPTANAKMALEYWRRFKPGIRTVIDFKVSGT